jgi:ABC-2 type transport system permease protein
VSRFVDVMRVVAWRSIHHYTHNPAFLIPSLLFPTFFFAAFAGGLSSVGDIPGFDYPAGYTTFMFGFVLMQASAFGGIFTGFGIAADFESGFARRMMLAAPNRLAILAGYGLSALSRTTWTAVYIFVLASLTGMDFQGGAADLLGLWLLALGIASVGILFSAGVALRMRTIQAGPLMQLPLFITLFLAPAYVPEHLLRGWVETAAAINPFTDILGAARDLLAGLHADLSTVALIFAIGLAVLGTWGVTGMRRAEADAA